MGSKFSSQLIIILPVISIGTDSTMKMLRVSCAIMNVHILCRQNHLYNWILLTMHVKKFEYRSLSLIGLDCHNFQIQSTSQYMEVRTKIAYLVHTSQSYSYGCHSVHILCANIVHPPRNLQVLSAIDTRIGFFGYVSLNISWEPPQSMSHI